MVSRNKIQKSFYHTNDVAGIARDLLGKYLFTCVGGSITGGIIVETEAYSHKERACHAYGNRQTGRNSVMFESGGVSYVYMIYGIHFLFNIVTNKAGIADAVLIRAIEPRIGIDTMMRRRDMKDLETRITAGPGSLSKALGITLDLYGYALDSDRIWLEYGDSNPVHSEIIHRKRIGVEYAKDDAELLWRFYLKNNDFVSKK